MGTRKNCESIEQIKIEKKGNKSIILNSLDVNGYDGLLQWFLL